MCITVFVDRQRFPTLRFMGEYILLRLENGELQVRELYDLFLESEVGSRGIELICVSPHDLLEDGLLRVQSHPIVKQRDDDEAFLYQTPLGKGAVYSEESGLVCVTLHRSTPEYAPTTVEFKGVMVTPTPSLPTPLQADACRRVMAQCGTVFRIDLPESAGGQTCAMRLVVEPARLNGIDPCQTIQILDRAQDLMKLQSLGVQSPKVNGAIVRSLLQYHQASRGSSALGEAAAAVLDALDPGKVRSLLPEEHRVVVVAPPNCFLFRNESNGCIWPSTERTLDDSRGLLEWCSGSRTYPMEDPYTAAGLILQYLGEWSKDNPKDVETVATATRINAPNCAAIMYVLNQIGAIQVVNEAKGLYGPAESEPGELAEALRLLVNDPCIEEQYVQTGFDSRFSLMYHKGSDEREPPKA